MKRQLQMSLPEPGQRRTKAPPTFGLDGCFDVQSIPVSVEVGVGFDRPVGTDGCGVLRAKDKHAATSMHIDDPLAEMSVSTIDLFFLLFLLTILIILRLGNPLSMNKPANIR